MIVSVKGKRIDKAADSLVSVVVASIRISERIFKIFPKCAVNIGSSVSIDHCKYDLSSSMMIGPSYSEEMYWDSHV
jgi:hypothetical protein